jgi:hypothetical protein
MPSYTFTISGEPDGHEVVLKDDDAAWSELVTWSGEVLRDVDGKLPSNSRLEICVSDDAGSDVARLSISTTRRSPR